MTTESNASTGAPPAPGTAAKPPVATENPLVVLVCNIVLPALILTKMSAPGRFGPMGALGVALIFPVGFGIYDFAKRRRANPISLLGFVSILLTGSFGLLHLDGRWFAFKEATIPTLMGVAVVGSLKTRYPLVKTLLYNDKVIDVAKVDQELAARGNVPAFNRLLVVTTWMLACSFMLSAVLNFTLAKVIIHSPAGSVEFNQELGKMTAMSYPVIVAPCMVVTLGALWWLISGIRKMTGLDLETIFKNQPPKKAS